MMDFLKELGFTPHKYTRYLFFVAVSLIIAMSFVSEFNKSPDEIHHFYAVDYYTNHFFSPEYDNPEIRKSYSVFGVSYLNYHWFEYFTAGKFVAVLSIFTDNKLTSVRLFNAFLFALLAFLFVRKSNEEIGLGTFLLVSPQVWYIFSYANNDAFALFVSMILCYQIAFEKTIFNQFLQDKNLLGGIFFGILIGILLTLKTNYYTFLLFIGLWLLWKFRLKFFKKFAYILLFAAIVFTFRINLDLYTNSETNFVGLSYLNYFSGNFEQQKSKLMAIQEEYADENYKPSKFENDLQNTDSSMKLKTKGVPYKDLFKVWRWHEVSFKSFVGVYGYMNIFAPRIYYWLMTLVFAAFGLYLFGAMVYAKRYAETLITWLCFGLTIFVSTYLSWTYAVQAQGRYLFPIIPMFTILVYSNRKYLHNFWMNAFFVAAFLLSVYSFIFIGLANING
jgi:hypothetical protein